MTLYILTGSPGGGKTTLIRWLEYEGHPVINEAATDIITLEQALGVPKPWIENGFIEKILKLQKQRIFFGTTSKKPMFIDRSPICTYALCKFLNIKIPQELLTEINRISASADYSKEVFFIENLGYIEKTTARQITLNEAIAFEKMHLEAYRNFGFKCIITPPMPLAKRGNFILNCIKKDHFDNK